MTLQDLFDSGGGRKVVFGAAALVLVTSVSLILVALGEVNGEQALSAITDAAMVIAPGVAVGVGLEDGLSARTTRSAPCGETPKQ